MELQFIGWKAAAVQALQIVVYLLNLLILVRVILSFFPYRDHPLILGIYRVTEPILAPFRLILPAGPVGLDISPLIAFFVINAVYKLLVTLIISL